MNCIKCNTVIPQKRLEIISGCKTCVNCSTAAPKRGVPIMKGTGDHTWVELEIMEQDQFEKYNELMGIKINPASMEIQDWDTEPSKEKINLNNLEEE
jgi:hypothetical protein